MGDPVGPVVVGLAFSFVLSLASIGSVPSARKSVGRTIAFATVFALLSALPLVLWSALELASSHHASLVVSETGCAASSVMFCLYARPRFAGKRVAANAPGLPEAPQVFPAGFLERVAELASKLGLSKPYKVILVRTLHLATQAWASSLVSPTLGIADGIVERLDPPERDAIVAHELAHFATHSLWLLALTPVVASLGAVVVSMSFGLAVSIVFGFALYMGLKRVVQRRVEIACDVVGARASGSVSMVRGLTKIHAAVDLASEGLISYVVFATTTHPPRALRLAALKSKAPPEERDQITVNRGEVLRHRVSSALAFTLWVALMSFSLWIGNLQDGSPAAFLLASIVVAPTLLLQHAQRSKLVVNQRRVARKELDQALGILAGVLMGVPVVVIVITQFDNPFAAPSRSLALYWAIPLVVGLFLFAIVMRRALRRGRMRRTVLIALQLQEYGRALALEVSEPRLTSEDPVLRHDLALAVAFSGDRAKAAERLEKLASEKGSLPIALITLAVIYADEANWPKCLDAATRGMLKLPQDAGPLFQAARARRALGQSSEAAALLARARALMPRDGGLVAFEALLALDRGDPETARSTMARALELSPGAPFVVVARAELSLSVDPVETARANLQAAKRVAASSPIAFVSGWVSRLDQKLTAGESR